MYLTLRKLRNKVKHIAWNSKNLYFWENHLLQVKNSMTFKVTWRGRGNLSFHIIWVSKVHFFIHPVFCTNFKCERSPCMMVCYSWTGSAKNRIVGKGAGIHIFVFCIINFFWNRLFLQSVNTNKWICPSPFPQSLAAPAVRSPFILSPQVVNKRRPSWVCTLNNISHVDVKDFHLRDAVQWF